MIVDSVSGTRIDEVGDRIFRISTPVPPSAMPGGFTFNQYLVVDDAPLLFHTGLRALSGSVRQAVSQVMPFERLRYISFSHVEADECGGLNDLLAAAPAAVPVCGRVAAMVSIGDLADRPPLALEDGGRLSLGQRSIRWFDAPHLPHGWECGYIFEETTRTLFCGDLFTQPGHEAPPRTESDVLMPSEAFRRADDYYAHARNTGPLLDRLASADPVLLACMHGSAFAGDGAALLRGLKTSLAS